MHFVRLVCFLVLCSFFDVAIADHLLQEDQTGSVYIIGENHNNPRHKALKKELMLLARDHKILAAFEGLFRSSESENEYFSAMLGSEPGLNFGYEDECSHMFSGVLFRLGYIQDGAYTDQHSVQTLINIRSSIFFRSHWDEVASKLTGGAKKLHREVEKKIRPLINMDSKPFIYESQNMINSCVHCSIRNWQSILKEISLLMLSEGCPSNPLDDHFKELVKTFVNAPKSDWDLQVKIISNINGVWRERPIFNNITSLAKYAKKLGVEMYVTIGEHHLSSLRKKAEEEGYQFHFINDLNLKAEDIENCKINCKSVKPKEEL
jgi:hypothetical protein